MTGLNIWTRCFAISARRNRRMSSSLLPENIGPTTTSIQPMLPFTMSTLWSPGARLAHCPVKIEPARTQSRIKSCCKGKRHLFHAGVAGPGLEILRINRVIEKWRKRMDHRGPKCFLPGDQIACEDAPGPLRVTDAAAPGERINRFRQL